MPEIISQAKLRRAIRMQERKIAWMLINTKHATIAERKEQALALEFIQAKLRRAIEVQEREIAADRAARQGKGI